MDWFVWTGFTIGIFGSLHCLGMCGPLVMAIPHISDTKAGVALDGVIYNFGRTLSYTSMGVVLGLLGVSAKFAGIQNILSIVVGILLLLSLVIPRKYYSFVNDKKRINKFVIRLKSQFRSLIEKRSKFSLLFLGILNGFLPCGLVYVALAGSLALGDLLSSALYMFAFGLGTIPLLAVVYFSKDLISSKLRVRFNRAVPYAIGVVAILLILRGMNLGIPFISPELHRSEITTMQECH